MTMRSHGRRHLWFSLFLNPLLIAGLGLGSPTYALRPMPDEVGLEERLAPQGGLEEWKEQLAELKGVVRAKQKELNTLFQLNNMKEY